MREMPRQCRHASAQPGIDQHEVRSGLGHREKRIDHAGFDQQTAIRLDLPQQLLDFAPASVVCADQQDARRDPYRVMRWICGVGVKGIHVVIFGRRNTHCVACQAKAFTIGPAARLFCGETSTLRAGRPPEPARDPARDVTRRTLRRSDRSRGGVRSGATSAAV